MEIVTIRKIKRPGPIFTWSGYVVADDQFGLWVFTPTESIVHSDTGATPYPLAPGFLALIPPTGWWIAGWVIREDVRRLEIDACTPATLIDGIWTWTDLELDVCRDETGRIWVEDETEFEAAVAAGHIPSNEAAEATAVTADIEQKLYDNDAPFDNRGWDIFDRAAALNLKPLPAPSA